MSQTILKHESSSSSRGGSARQSLRRIRIVASLVTVDSKREIEDDGCLRCCLRSKGGSKSVTLSLRGSFQKAVFGLICLAFACILVRYQLGGSLGGKPANLLDEPLPVFYKLRFISIVPRPGMTRQAWG